MKQIIIVLTFFYAVSANGQSNTLNTVLKPSGECKEVKSKVYMIENGFCSTALHIDNDSTFTFESGCEGRSRVSIGKWLLMNDSLFLLPFKQNEIRPFCKVEGYSSNDSSVTFVIKDKFGSSLNKLIKPLGREMDIQDPFMLYLFANSWRDSLSINKSEAKELDFPGLNMLTGNNFKLKTNELPEFVNITLNINSAALMYDEIEYVYDQIPKCWIKKGNTITSGNLVLKLTE